MTNASHTLSRWKFRHAAVTWLGIVLNLAVAIPFFFAPVWSLDLLNIPHPPLIWARVGAMLLVIITAFYVPMTIDLDRFRIFAWLAIFPSRTFGATYFTVAVVVFGQAPGFLAIALVDAFIAILWLWCMFHIVKLEQDIATGRGAT